jgi:uncharacterized protein YcbX
MKGSARVAALYRHPVKGFTPQACESLTVLDGGRIAGDRVLGVRFANAAAAGDEWGTKHDFVALVNTPGLARLDVRFDAARRRLSIRAHAGGALVEAVLDEPGRRRIAAALQDYVLGLAENPLAAHPERLPLRVVGDGITPRYQDSMADFVTLHGRASLAALAAAAGDAALSELRFRSNIAVEGLEAWEEQAWAGKIIGVGPVRFAFVRAKGRCLATHANPATGERDVPVMQILPRVYAAEKPLFAVALATLGRGGTIRVGDAVRILEAQ